MARRSDCSGKKENRTVGLLSFATVGAATGARTGARVVAAIVALVLAGAAVAGVAVGAGAGSASGRLAPASGLEPQARLEATAGPGSDFAGIYEKVSARFQLRLDGAAAAVGAGLNEGGKTAVGVDSVGSVAAAPAQAARPEARTGLSLDRDLDVRFSPAGVNILRATARPAQSLVLAEWSGIQLSISGEKSAPSATDGPSGTGTAMAIATGAAGGSAGGTVSGTVSGVIGGGPGQAGGLKFKAGYAVGSSGDSTRYTGGVQAEMDLIPKLVTVSGQFNLVDVDALAGSGRQRTARAGVSGEFNLSARASVKAGYEVEKPLSPSPSASSAPSDGTGSGDAVGGNPGSGAGGSEGGFAGGSSGLISSTSVGVGYELSDEVSVAANYKLINFTGGENAKPRADQEASAELLVKF